MLYSHNLLCVTFLIFDLAFVQKTLCLCLFLMHALTFVCPRIHIIMSMYILAQPIIPQLMLMKGGGEGERGREGEMIGEGNGRERGRERDSLVDRKGKRE